MDHPQIYRRPFLFSAKVFVSIEGVALARA